MADDRLQKIIDFYKKQRRMPSYAEIVLLFGLRSKSAVYKFVSKLLDNGLINKDKQGRLIPSAIFNEIPILGSVRAGWPSPAEEEIPDTLSIEDYLINNKEATYLFKVRGDSMNEAGIMDGDMALVERGRPVKDGDIVLAEIDRQWTLKYFRKRNGKVYLQPANKNYPDIIPKEELKIAAVLVSVIRKYKI